MGASEETRKRIAVVFGGGSGIGAATALELGRRGYHVVVAGRRLDRLRAVTAELDAHGGSSAAVVADVTRDDDVRRVFEEVAAAGPALHLIVNCAGLGHMGALADTTPARFQEVVTTNLVGAYRTAFYGLPLLRAGRGQIVNVLSRAGRRPYAGLSAYGTSKAALVHLTRALSLELQEAGIRVNGVSPGAAATPLRRELFPDEDPSRLLRPEEVARVIAWLVEAPSPHVTGTVVDLPW